jgi:circadian clock protein KaiB
MPTNETPNAAAALHQALRNRQAQRYLLRLYVSGSTPKSAAAIRNLRQFCDEFLKGRYDLEVIDIFQRPQRARDDQIVAAPTLVRELPGPLRKLVGDLSDPNRVLIGLDLQAGGKETAR